MAAAFGSSFSGFGGSGGAFGGSKGYSGVKVSSPSIFDNLIGDVKSSVEGFGPGLLQLVEHPNKTGAAVLSNYKSTYGPLAHGDFDTFFHTLHQHPLGPILDIAALASAGAGTVGKIVNASTKAGEEGSILSHLAYRPGEVSLKQFDGAQSGFTKATSANPLSRARETVIHNAMQKLPSQLKFFGTDAQYTRALRKVGNGSEISAHINLLSRQAKSFYELKNKTERSVANAMGSGLKFGEGPESYLRTIRNANPDVEIPHETIEALTSPEAKDLFKRVHEQNKSGNIIDPDVQRVLNYNHASKLAGEADAAIKIKNGSLTEDAAEIRKYQHIIVAKGGRWLPTDKFFQTDDGRIIHETQIGKRVTKDGRVTTGAEKNIRDENTAYDIVTGKKIDLNELEGGLKELTPAEAHSASLTHGYQKAEYGWVDKHGNTFDTEALAQELTDEGHPGVHYVPDKTIFRNENAGGVSPRNPAVEATRGTPESHLETYLHGQLLLNQNLLGKEFLGSINVARANAIFDKLEEHGLHTGPQNLEDVLNEGAEPKFAPPEKGFVYLKPRGDRLDATDFLDQSRPEFSRLMGDKPGLTQRAQDFYKVPNPLESVTYNPLEAAYDGGGLTQVPLHIVQQAAKDVRRSSEGIQSLLHKPTQVWKNFVLATRPGFLTTNVVGNTLLYGLRHAGPTGAWALGKAIFDKGEGERLTAGVSKSWVDRVMPEQSIEHTFTNTQIVNQEFSATRFQRNFHKWLSTLYGINAKHEAMLRRATIDAAARELPEIKESLSRLNEAIKTGRSTLKPDESKIEHVIEHASPGVREKISSMTDDVMGNYRDFSQGETYLRELVPFYAWNRHAARTTAAILGDRPGVAALSAATGQVGYQDNQTLLGDVPEFMRLYAPIDTHLPGIPKSDATHQTILNTSSINPFETVLQTGQAVSGLVNGHPGNVPPELLSNLSPFIQSGIEQITGKSVLSGGPVKNDVGGGILGALIRPYLSTSQVQIGEKLLGLTPPASPNTVTAHNWNTTGLSFLGLPINSVNKTASQAWQKKRESEALQLYKLVKNN